MADEPIYSSLEIMIGEMRGQLKEMIHNVNNIAHTQNLMYDKLAGLVAVPADLAEFKIRCAAEIAEIKTTTSQKVTAVEGRVTLLETEKNKRDGAMTVVGGIFKSPFFVGLLGICAGAASTVFLILKG